MRSQWSKNVFVIPSKFKRNTLLIVHNVFKRTVLTRTTCVSIIIFIALRFYTLNIIKNLYNIISRQYLCTSDNSTTTTLKGKRKRKEECFAHFVKCPLLLWDLTGFN